MIACSNVSDTVLPYYFIVLNAFFLPLVFVCIFSSVSASVYYYYQLKAKRVIGSADLNASQQSKLSNLFLKIWTILTRIVLWLFLVFYPSICSIILSVFNCRDFGSSGSFLVADNQVSCDASTYSGFLVLSAAGVGLYVVGIPLAFFYAIKHRESRLWCISSKFLHHGFVDDWKYYEIVDLVRKLLITSVTQFVASPNTPSQVLFMLLIDCVALYLLSTAKPFKHSNDDSLCTVLTTIECVAFLFAMLVVSDISETEGYNSSTLFYTLVFMMFAALFIVAPYTLMMKIDFLKIKFEEFVDKGQQKFLHYFPKAAIVPDLSRLSAHHRLFAEVEELRESVSYYQRASSMYEMSPIRHSTSLKHISVVGVSGNINHEESEDEVISPLQS